MVVDSPNKSRNDCRFMRFADAETPIILPLVFRRSLQFRQFFGGCGVLFSLQKTPAEAKSWAVKEQNYTQQLDEARRYKVASRLRCAQMGAEGRGAELVRENRALLGIDLSKGRPQIIAIGNVRIKNTP